MQNGNRYRTVILAVLALVLTVFSFHGALDNFAHERVVETTNESILIFAISRGINAGIPLLQSWQIEGSAVVASSSCST